MRLFDLGLTMIYVFVGYNLVIWIWLLLDCVKEAIRDQQKIDARLHDMIKNERK